MTKYGEEDLDVLSDPFVRMPADRIRKRSAIAAALGAVLRLVFPVAALLAVFAAAGLAQHWPLEALGSIAPGPEVTGAGLTGAHLVVPFSFLAIHLANRAYGAGFALAQVLIAWTALIGACWFFAPEITSVLPGWQLPPEPTAFAASLIGGHLAAVAVFHMTRGPVWWKAPLYAGIIGAIVYVGLYHTLTPLRPEGLFAQALAADAGINLAMAVLLVLPYWLARPMIRPLPGYGGA